MRFCDFFINYKIGLKEIKNTIPFTKLPLYRKIAVIVTFAISIVGSILFVLKYKIAAFISLIIGFALLAIFICIDSKKRNLETMLKNHYMPHSQKRMNMIINILQQYGINIHNNSAIDLLIEEAQTAQTQCDYIAPLKKPLKTLGAIIIPIIAFVAQKIGDAATQDEIITMAAQTIILILLFFSLIFSLAPMIKEILYFDYNKYNELIYDLRQLKLFYTKENTTSTK